MGLAKLQIRGKDVLKLKMNMAMYTQNIDVAEFLNNYYVNVGPSLSEDH